MPSIARTLPLGWSDRCRVEMLTGGEVLPLITGGARRYTELDEPLRRYTLRPTLMLDTSTELEQWTTLIGQVHRDDGILWIPEPVSANHRGLRCGPITDGTRTTYPIPVINPSDVTVFVDGVPQDSSTYTLHAAANGAGDYDVTHPAGLCPGAVEFDTAPAAGSRITASATGRRLTRCVLSPVSQWSASSRHPTVQTIEAIESPEV